MREVYVYDLDGSYAKPLAQRIAAGQVRYEDGFKDLAPFGRLFAEHGVRYNTSFLVQSFVQNHCWRAARHDAEWVLMVSHGWDMFLSPTSRSDELSRAKRQTRCRLSDRRKASEAGRGHWDCRAAADSPQRTLPGPNRPERASRSSAQDFPQPSP